VSNISPIVISGTGAGGDVTILFNAQYQTNSNGGSGYQTFLLTLTSGSNPSVLQLVSPESDFSTNFDINIPLDSFVQGVNAQGVIASPAEENDNDENIDALLLFDAELAVDSNRDGTIAMPSDPPQYASNGNLLPVDTTSQSKPFQFWINNDDDAGTANPAGSDVVNEDQPIPNEITEPVLNQDWESNTIVSQRDLEDWTRLWIYTKGMNAGINAGTIKVGLKWTQVTRGTPGIKIVQATDADGGLEYLSSTTSAEIQMGSPAVLQDANIVPSTGVADFVFPVSVWENLSDAAPKTFFLFEGTGEGEGQLQIVFLKNDGVTEIGEGGSLWLDLRDIKEMYTRAVANPQPPHPYYYTSSQPPEPNIRYSIDTSNVPSLSGTFVPNPNEDTSNPTYIVFVHGFNMSYAGSTNYAETLFKRLWQLGYKGRFASFRWPTHGTGWTFLGFTLSGIGIFNDCEYIAWESGAPLNQFVTSLSNLGYKVDVMSHSLGSVVVGAALQEGMKVQYYSMSHAAASASLYSSGTSCYAVTNNFTTPDTDSDAFTRSLAYSNYQGTSSLGYIGYLGGISGNVGGGPITNFYDEGDSVITNIWGWNNEYFKPNVDSLLSSYSYSTVAPSREKLQLWGVSPFSPLRFVTDPSEAKAYVDQSLTGTIGSNTGLYGSVKARQDEDNMLDDHSYEWDNPIQDSVTLSFYETLMGPSVYNLDPISMPTSP
jgi:hypothetical protein